jgi:hypothetical protein
MGFVVKYRTPYELATIGREVKSGKNVINLYHMQSGIAGGLEPAYASPLAGSDSAIVLAGFQTAIVASVCPRLSVNYKIIAYTMRSIDGVANSRPPIAVAGVIAAGAQTHIFTAANHGLNSGDTATIAGVLGTTSVNGTFTITKDSPVEFHINVTANAPYTGGGTVSRAGAPPSFIHLQQDSRTPAVPDSGTVAGDALPLVASMSVRKINNRVGREWRGRLSISPLPEAGYKDGKAEDAQHTANVTAWNNFPFNTIANQAAPVLPQDYMNYGMISAKMAYVQPSPFTTEVPWFAPITDFVPRQNLGVISRRKPKLTTPIA